MFQIRFANRICVAITGIAGFNEVVFRRIIERFAVFRFS